jgi:hypothetical protein
MRLGGRFGSISAVGRVDTKFRTHFGPQGLVSIMGHQNFGESISIRPSEERVIPTILYLARMAIIDVAILLTAPPRDPIDGISIFVPGRGKHGLIAEHRTQAIMCTFCLFIDVRLLEHRGVEAQQLAVAPIGLGARSKPAQCFCQFGGWNGRRSGEAYQQNSARGGRGRRDEGQRRDRPPGQGAHPRQGPADGGELRLSSGAAGEGW